VVPLARPPATLASLFTDYLASGRAPRPTAQLASVLQERGYPLEAAALAGTSGSRVDVAGSPWNGRRLWTGTQLPAGAQAGDVWLDTCQLTPTVLVPYEEASRGEDLPSDLVEPVTTCIGWIDTRPVQEWQLIAFLTLARLTEREVQLDPPIRLLDRQRVLHGHEQASVTELTPDEARLCANWFGKAVCHLTAWQAASAFLPAAVMLSLWGEPAREWAGSFEEGLNIVVSPSTIDADPSDEADADEPLPADKRMLFGEWARPKDVTFRSYVHTQIGLLTEPSEDGAWWVPLRLASRAPRERLPEP
jgi:hypothetical protein